MFKRLKTVDALGVFCGTKEPHAPETEFRRLNAIYGYNGSGKTTLSRLFATIQNGVLDPELPPDAKFQFELASGDLAASDESHPIGEKVRVFNSDFAGRNFDWIGGTASGFAYIGKGQVELGAKLGDLEARLGSLDGQYATAVSESKVRVNAYDTFKRDVARLIGDAVGTERTYRAPNLEADYEDSSSQFTSLGDADVRAIKEVLALDEAPPAIAAPAMRALQASVLIYAQRASSTLSTILPKVAAGLLAEHPEMFSWVNAGLEYHRSANLSECLFCGHSLEHSRLDQLSDLMAMGIGQLLDDTLRLAHEGNVIADRIHKIRDSLAGPDFDRSVGGIGLRHPATELNSALEILANYCTEAATKLLERSQNVLTNSSDHKLPNIEQILIPMMAAASDLEAAIDRINEFYRELTEGQERERLRYKAHLLGQYRAAFESHRAEAEAAVDARTSLNSELEEVRAEISRTLAAMKDTAPAAEEINRLLKSYLRHSKIQIVPALKGFEIKRDGRAVGNTLSEGEKNAVIFCHFLSSLEADGAKLEDLVVVIDDPVSSLDTRAMSYAFELIRSRLKGVAQLIILTHNLPFAIECAKWLKRHADIKKAKDAPPQASLMFIELRQSGDERKSALTKLPALIREYESEYHYLFSKVFALASSHEGAEDFMYLLPNAMRKVLDIFFAFEFPGSDGFDTKIARACKEVTQPPIDEAQVLSLQRLAALESHAESVDDFGSFSAMSLEQVRDCALALVTLIQRLAPRHAETMIKLCERAAG